MYLGGICAQQLPRDDADTTNIQCATPCPEPFLGKTTIKSSPFHYEGGALTVAFHTSDSLNLPEVS